MDGRRQSSAGGMSRSQRSHATGGASRPSNYLSARTNTLGTGTFQGGRSVGAGRSPTGSRGGGFQSSRSNMLGRSHGFGAGNPNTLSLIQSGMQYNEGGRRKEKKGVLV